MLACRLLRATEPGKQLSLIVNAKHPEMGLFFKARLDATACQGPCKRCSNETAGLMTFFRWACWAVPLLCLYVKELPRLELIESLQVRISASASGGLDLLARCDPALQKCTILPAAQP